MVGLHEKWAKIDFDKDRKEMVDALRLSSRNISEKVFSAMERVPRHLFVPESVRHRAYVDSPLSIGSDQTISAPHMVAIMCNLLDLHEGLNVLEIGAGSGYHAAVISEMIGGGKVYSIERIESVAKVARTNLSNAGYTNVEVIVSDGTLGLPNYAPYDRISVTCAAPDVPSPLIDQLKDGGIMAIPVGKLTQYLYIIEKKDKKITRDKKMGVVFVPLIGEHGF